jgi:hypothetical protein
VYVTVDNHRLNDFKPYIWVSTDFGQSFKSIVNNLSGENVRTLTEDPKNRDVLYIGTETGIFLSLDRGASWQKLKANFPDVRVDEITIHPRDNAMLIATHGRAIWVLDHLEPIQEYSSAKAVSADAKLFSVPTALEWKTKDDRNDEFWGHSYFIGENPPNEAMVQYLVNHQASDLKLRVSDVGGKVVREIKLPSSKMEAGVQTACWDMRVEPIEAPEAEGAAPAGGRGGRGGGGGGGGGGRGGRGGAPAAPPVPGVPQPVPTPIGHMNSCLAAGDSTAPAARGGGGGFGGGLGGPGPYAMPGAYTVALVEGTKTLDSKPLKVVFDPDVKFAAGELVRYIAVVADLHSIQRRGTAAAGALNSLYPQMTDAAKKVGENSSIPANVKSQFESLQKEFDAARKKFGVPINANPAGGRGGGRGAAVDPDNDLAKTSGLKNSIMRFWEAPSGSLLRQYNEVKLSMPKAVADANAVLTHAATVSAALKKYDITLTVPPTVK